MKSANLCWSSFSLSCCRCTSSFRHCKENIIKQPISFSSSDTHEDLYQRLYFSSFRGRDQNWDRTLLRLLIWNRNVKQSSWCRVSRITVILLQMSGILPCFWQQLITNASKGEILNGKLATSSALYLTVIHGFFFHEFVHNLFWVNFPINPTSSTKAFHRPPSTNYTAHEGELLLVLKLPAASSFDLPSPLYQKSQYMYSED